VHDRVQSGGRGHDLLDAGLDGAFVGDVELDGSEVDPVRLGEVVQVLDAVRLRVSVARIPAMTWWPASTSPRTASAPKPLEAPVIRTACVLGDDVFMAT
jgi:hypothetical protein